MSRFSSIVFAVALCGCAGPAPVVGPLLPLSPASPSAFEGDPGALAAPPQAWRQEVDPIELTGDQVDFPAHRLLPSDESPTISQEDAGRRVVGILREFVAPGKWNPNALTMQDGTLVTRQPPGVLQALQSALRTLKDHQGRMIRTRFRKYLLHAGALARLENIPPVGGGLVGTFDQRSLLETLGDSDPIGVAGPVLDITTFHGQKSHLMTLSQKAYVCGFDVAKGSVDPIQAIATEGVVAELRSIANGDRAGEFLLSFEIQVASPPELVDIRLGAGLLQMPAQGYARLSGRCALRPDQALLLVTRNPSVRRTERPILAMVVTLDWAD